MNHLSCICAGLPKGPHGTLFEHELLFGDQLLSICQRHVSLSVMGLLGVLVRQELLSALCLTCWAACCAMRARWCPSACIRGGVRGQVLLSLLM